MLDQEVANILYFTGNLEISQEKYGMVKPQCNMLSRLCGMLTLNALHRPFKRNGPDNYVERAFHLWLTLLVTCEQLWLVRSLGHPALSHLTLSILQLQSPSNKA